MRRPFYVFVCVSMILTNKCFCQFEADQYLTFKAIADQFQAYTIRIENKDVAKYLSSKQLKQTFEESFAFLEKKKLQSTQSGNNLNILVVIDSPIVFIPVPQYLRSGVYNVVGKYSVTIKLQLNVTPDSVVLIPLCVDRLFTKEKEVFMPTNYETARMMGNPTSIQDAIDLDRNSYKPKAWDIKNCLLSVLDYYRRKVNIQ